MHLCKPVLFGLLLTILVTGIGPGLGSIAHLAAADNSPAENVSQGQTTEGKAASEDDILLNFKNVDILKIIDVMSDLIGKNFLVDEKVKGKVTVVSPRPVSVDEAYQVLLSVLEIKGFTVVPQGPIVKIVPVQGVMQRPLPTTIDDRKPPSATSDAFITQLIPLAFADVNDIRTLLTPLVSKASSLLAYPPTNTLILTDVASNISRLLKIIQALDIEAPSVLFKVITLQYAAAEQLADSLQAVLGGLAHAGRVEGEKRTPGTRKGGKLTPSSTSKQTPKAPTKIVADNRTNSLVVIATLGTMAVAEELIARLDVPTPEGQGQIHVHYLDHIDAAELADVLTAQATEIARVTAETEAKKTSASPARSAQRAGGVTSSGSTSTGITITAHLATNSLVITASPGAYALMKGIIEKLDIRRSQVLVESLIAEVTIDQTEAFGVEWRIIDEPNGTRAFGSSLGTGTAGVLNAISANPLAAPPGLLIGVLRNSITIAGQEVFNIPAILRASQTNTDVNILANPNLLAIDNEEAQIIIGENRPFLTSATVTPAGGVLSTTSNFEFRDTGITLRIKPKISKSGTIRLNLFLELTTFVSEAETGAVTTTKRRAETSVIMDNGQTIIVGGLIRDDKSATLSQVPCLGNLPLFGWLFKQRSNLHRKTNLLIFLTPHILATPDDAHIFTEHKRQQSEKADEIKKQLQQNQPQGNLELLLD